MYKILTATNSASPAQLLRAYASHRAASRRAPHFSTWLRACIHRKISGHVHTVCA